MSHEDTTKLRVERSNLEAELVQLAERANDLAIRLELAAGRLRSEREWPIHMESDGSPFLIPVDGHDRLEWPKVPGMGDVLAVAIRSNEVVKRLDEIERILETVAA